MAREIQSTMGRFYVYKFTCIILLGFLGLHSVSAQDLPDIWNIPWKVVGDSNEWDSSRKLIITGVIKAKGSREPVQGASISADLFKHFDYSDQNGHYVLEMPPGRYKITIRHVGMRPIYLKIIAVSSDTLNAEMEEGTTELEELVISSRPIDSNIKESLPGLTTMNIKEVKTLPTLMGEVDIIKSIQLMPGVSSVGEGSSGFNVRGGRTDQNLVLLNDAPLFNTSHALGFVSAFNQDVLNDFNLYKGNVPANLGGRASSVLKINTRRGDFEDWKYQIGAGPISGRITIEGPLKTSTTSLLIAGRGSYADWILRKVRDPYVKQSSASFFDGIVSFSHRFTENSTADVTYYGSKDNFRFADQFGYTWDNQVASAKWQGLTNRAASPSVSLSYGNFSNTLIDPSGIDASELTNSMNYMQIKPTVNFIPDEQHNAIIGMEVIGYFAKPEKIQGYKGNSAVSKTQVNKDRGIEYSFFFNDDFEISEKVSFSIGTRYSRYIHIGADTIFQYQKDLPRTSDAIVDTSYHSSFETIKEYGGFEPRISARISITPQQSVKLSYNRMRQYIHLITNTTAPTPVDLWQVSNAYIPPQISDNFSFGYFLNLKNNKWETSAEVFLKKLENLIEYKDFPSLYLNRHLETELLTGKGEAYGGEIFIRKLKGKWTGWISYTYSQTKVKVSSPHESENINKGEWFPSNYNKPHIFNLVVDRKLLKGGGFSFIASFNSGRPLTAIETSYIVDDVVVPVYSERNKYNIPNYFRVDISITIGNVINKLDDNLIFSVYNLFGRDNAYSVFYQRPVNRYFIPKAYRLSILGAVLPSLTYNLKF